MRKRKVWVEPKFGEAKECHGMGRFRPRTLWRVNAEALVTAAGQNVKRLLDFSGRRPRKMAQARALQPTSDSSGAAIARIPHHSLRVFLHAAPLPEGGCIGYARPRSHGWRTGA